MAKNSCFSEFFPYRNWGVPPPPLTENHCAKKSLRDKIGLNNSAVPQNLQLIGMGIWYLALIKVNQDLTENSENLK